MKKIQKILIVDDDYVALFLAKETARSVFRDAVILTAGNVDLALETIKENAEGEFIIFLSMDMRFKNAEHFLRAFSRVGGLSVVYLVSAMATETGLMRSYSFVRGHLKKPLSINNLKAVLRDAGPVSLR